MAAARLVVAGVLIGRARGSGVVRSAWSVGDVLTGVGRSPNPVMMSVGQGENPFCFARLTAAAF